MKGILNIAAICFATYLCFQGKFDEANSIFILVVLVDLQELRKREKDD